MSYSNFITGELQEIKAHVSKLESLDKPSMNFLHANLNNWLESEEREKMIVSQRYYEVKHDIRDKKRTYIDRLGVVKEAKNLNNSKLAHPFLRKLTNQKVNYLLSKEFSIQTDDEKFAEDINIYFDKNLLTNLKNVAKQSVVKGIAWLQVYYNEKGELKFKIIPSEEVIPFWVDSEHTELAGILRPYNITEFKKDGSQHNIEKVEYYTTEGVWHFINDKDGLKVEKEAEGHFNLLEENKKGELEEVAATWNRIPFIAFKYNPEEIGLLTTIKDLVDEYDKITSNTSDIIMDVPDSIKIVKGYDGTDKEEFTENLSTFRTAFVREEGDFSVVETPLDIEARDRHLDRLRKDIYDFGGGVDTQDAELGNASGISIKFKYTDLDLDVNDMANEVKTALDNMIWFIKIDMLNKGIGDYSETEYEIIFNTDTVINEKDVVEVAKESVGIISDETIVANHPWVVDTDAELERIKKERSEYLTNFVGSDDNQFNYGTDEPNEAEEETDEEAVEE